jgi:cation transporter-like permease
LKNHIYFKIVKESLKILILASILSSIGGIGLQWIEQDLFSILPLLILLPALNDLIGNFGTTISSKFTTMLFMGEIGKKSIWSSKKIHQIFGIITGVSLMAALYISILSYFISVLKGFPLDFLLLGKIIEISLISVMVLTVFIFFVSIAGGMYIYKKDEDPDNFLIPITTSIADLGSMLIFSILVSLFF